jgi:hypothetical protein
VVNRLAIGVSLLLIVVVGAALSWRHFRVAVLAPSELRSTQPNPKPPPEPVKVEEYLQARSEPCDRPEASLQLPELRVELRPSEDGVLLFSPQIRHHLHFLLFSNQAGLKVYEDWNSWGYFAPSFKAEDGNCRTYDITRRGRDWDKNFPSTVTLDKGDFPGYRYLSLRRGVASIAKAADREDTHASDRWTIRDEGRQETANQRLMDRTS